MAITFSVMQPGNFDLVGTIIYEIDDHPFQSTFFNSTIEVAEAGGFLSMESVFLVTLGTALLVLLGLWIHGQIQHLSKVLKSLFFSNNVLSRIHCSLLMVLIKSSPSILLIYTETLYLFNLLTTTHAMVSQFILISNLVGELIFPWL